MEILDPKPTIGRASVESQDLIKFLKSAAIGQIFTYQEMNEAARCNVQTRNTVLQTARRTLLNDGIVFGTLSGVGIKRLSDDEIPDEGASAIKRSRRIARKGLRCLGCAKPENMSNDSKIKLFTGQTILGLFAASGSRKVMGLAEQGARVSNGKMQVGDVSSLFGK